MFCVLLIIYVIKFKHLIGVLMKLLSMNKLKLRLSKNDSLVIYVTDKKERIVIENLSNKILINHFRENVNTKLSK